MKRSVLTLLALALASLFSTTGCKKDTLGNKGIIVGWNYGSCAMCGGFYLNLSNKTTMDSSTCYVLNWSDTANALIIAYDKQWNTTHTPIYVYVNWQPINLVPPFTKTRWIRVTDIMSR